MASNVEKTILGKAEIHWRFQDKDNKHVEINCFMVKPDARHSGIGTRAFNAFVKSLGDEVESIELFAADMGEGRSNEFWEKQGFDYKHECFEEGDEQKLGTEAYYTMQIGLNGHEVEKISHETWHKDFEEYSNVA